MTSAWYISYDDRELRRIRGGGREGQSVVESRSPCPIRERPLQSLPSMRPREAHELARTWQNPSARIQRPASYARRAFTHPMNILLVTTLAVLGLATLPWLMPFAVVGVEIMFLIAASRMPVLRYFLDREEADLRREEALEARQRLLGAMNDEHRSELEHLELLLDSIRCWEGSQLIEDRLELGRLTIRYAEVAVAYRESKRRLSLTDCESVERQLYRIEQVASDQDLQRCADHLSRIRERRLRIARKRLETYQDNLARLELMRRELAAIGEYIRLLHEQTLAGFPPVHAATGEDDELGALITELDELQQGMDEVTRSLECGAESKKNETRSALSAAPPGSAVG